MKFKYQVETYHPIDAVLIVSYTPDQNDPEVEELANKSETLYRSIPVYPSMTEAQIKHAIIGGAPITKWQMPPCPAAQELVGKTFDGETFPVERTKETVQGNMRPRVLLNQFRLVLEERGLLDQFDRKLKAIPDQKKKRKLTAKFEYCPWVELHGDVAEFTEEALGMTKQQVLDLFLEASLTF